MNSKKFLAVHQPCPKECGKSSDAFAVREDGTGFCFSCGKNKKSDGTDQRKDMANVQHQEPQAYKYQYTEFRGIRKETSEFFGVKTAVSDSNETLFWTFPHPNGRQLNKSPKKEFWWTGEKVTETSLFGMNKFQPGGKAVTITEGYLDTMSVYQMFGSKYATVGVTSASSAKTECGAAYEYLDSFEKIYICMDSDEPGREAAQAVARLFDFNKVYMVALQRKDANEYLMAKEDQEFQRAWWAARRFLPEGILTSYAEFDKIIDEDDTKPSVPYPFERLQGMTYGARTGELVLLTAQEGMGKTEIFRALEYHFLKTTEDNIGIIHLEENKARTIKGLVGYEIQKPIHLPDFAIPKAEIKTNFRNLTKKDERVHVYSHFGSDDPDVILSTIRFMAGSCGCKRIFLDHITMVVTGLAGEDERRALDYISTRLAMMVEELDFTLFMISHVNDQGQTRGSRNIAKVADLRIDMYRDLTSESDLERNTTYLTISKNRFAGKTGPAGRLYFNSDTYVLSEQEEAPF